MGDYITIETLQERMSDSVLNDLCDGRSGSDRDIYLNGVIGRAESMIGGYAGKLYDIPLPASNLVSEWAFRISEHELYKNGQGNDIPVKYKDSYTEIMAQLKEMSNGNIVPEGSTTRKSNNTVGKGFDITSDDPMFTDLDADGYGNFRYF